jgi:hypothetical protein
MRTHSQRAMFIRSLIPLDGTAKTCMSARLALSSLSFPTQRIPDCPRRRRAETESAPGRFARRIAPIVDPEKAPGAQERRPSGATVGAVAAVGIAALSLLAGHRSAGLAGALTAAVTLVVIIVQAAVFGVLAPISLGWLKPDPAVGTGVFITAASSAPSSLNPSGRVPTCVTKPTGFRHAVAKPIRTASRCGRSSPRRRR